MSAIYSQRDPRWASQRLGTCDGTTIGGYGCYISSMAMVGSHFGHGETPADLDNIFTDRNLYVDGCLCVDNMLQSVFPEINYIETFDFSSRPADLSVLRNSYEDEYIIEVDFDHNSNDGIQTHFVRFVSWDGQTLIIDDPWFGTEDNFATNYGTDFGTTIQKIVHYRGPSPVAAPAPEPAPAPAPEPVVPAPIEQPSLPDAPISSATTEAQPTTDGKVLDQTPYVNTNPSKPCAFCQKGNIMQTISKIVEFLSGKKTYIIAGIIGAMNAGVSLGWISPSNITQINLVLGALGLGALRSGVTKSGK